MEETRKGAEILLAGIFQNFKNLSENQIKEKTREVLKKNILMLEEGSRNQEDIETMNCALKIIDEEYHKFFASENKKDRIKQEYNHLINNVKANKSIQGKI